MNSHPAADEHAEVATPPPADGAVPPRRVRRPAKGWFDLASTSLVFAAGNDWDRAAARKLPVGWVILDQWLSNGTGDTYWSQYMNHPTGKAGTRVSVRDTGPTNDQWNLAAVELVNSGD